MIILGIDPGIADTGWGFIEIKNHQTKVINFGSIKTAAGKELSSRLLLLYQELNQLIKKFKPDKMAVESVFFGVNAKTALLVGHAKGVVLLLGAQNKLEVNEYTPLQIKIAATGYGRADKLQMQKMIQKLLNLKKIPKSDDAADALAVALCDSVSNKKI